MAACPTIHRRLILGRYEEDGAMLESLMTSMKTKAQDGADLWEADARWVSTMSFNTALINRTL